MGKTLIDHAINGELDMFKRVFVAADDKELLFWHITKSFKAAVKAR